MKKMLIIAMCLLVSTSGFGAGAKKQAQPQAAPSSPVNVNRQVNPQVLAGAALTVVTGGMVAVKFTWHF